MIESKSLKISGLSVFPWLKVRPKSKTLNPEVPARSLVVLVFYFKINQLSDFHFFGIGCACSMNITVNTCNLPVNLRIDTS